MNKKEYVDAVNEINVTEKQKKEVFEKMKEKKNNVFFRLSLCTACLATIIVGILVPTKLMNKPQETINQNQNVQAQILPNVKNYEELYAILKEKSSKNIFRGGTEILIDEVQESTTADSITKNETSTDYSETNVQVEGVDEADIVKTDGDYIYYITNNSVIIVNAKDVKNLKIDSKIKFDESTSHLQELYIEKNKLIVIGQTYPEYSTYRTTDISYGNEISTVAKIYNIENRKNAKLEREVKIDGAYLTSRMIGENLFLIANKYTYSVCSRYGIDELKEEELLPTYTDTVTSQNKQCVSYEDIYYIPNGEESNYLNIASFNVNENKEANIASYIGVGHEIYASTENLYVVNTKYEYRQGIINKFTGNYTYTVNTNIYKFNLKDENASFVGEGSVPGTVLNQFSMDENNGYFRIATTNSTTWDNSTNNLYVLDDNLNIVGKVEDLAKGEKIYSVRFMGKRAYMVTFVQTDPLFVIDLSNPTNPTVLGELKIPGFSNYLHPYDETHIIGFGKDTAVENYGYGNIVRTKGMKMAMFDVSDVSNPKEMYNVKIGDSGTYSELLNNHKALLFSKEKNLLAFPISISKDTDNYYYTFQGAIVYNVDLQNGFTLKGQISHKENNDNSYFYYDEDKDVDRIIYIDNVLITLSPNLIKVTDMNTIEKVTELEIK